MTKPEIEKYIALGRKKKLTAAQLSQLLTQPPHNFSAAEASEVYFSYLNACAKPLETPLQSSTRALKCWKKHLKPGKFPENAGEVVCGTGRANSISEVVEKAVQAGTFPSVLAKECNYTPSILNRSAVKAYALGVSEKHRAGKFKRVSPAFVQGVEAELEAFIRGLDKGDELDTLTLSFINAKRALPKVEELLNRAVRRIIIRRVHSHPSKGQTLR